MADSFDDTTGERPPRRRRPIPLWVKVSAALVVVFVILPGGYLWWVAHSAERALQAKIAEIRAAGEPIDLEDFDPTPVPDDQNAYLAFVDAAAGVSIERGEEDEDDPLIYPYQVAGMLDRAKEIIEANAGPLELARHARTLPRVDTGMRMRSPAITLLLRDLAAFKQLGKLLCATAAYRHHAGDGREAVETLRDVVRLARVFDGRPTVIDHLVSLSIDRLGVDTVEQIAPRLGVGSKPAGTPAAAGTRRQVSLLIEELLDEAEIQEGLLRAFLSERALLLDTALCLIDGKLHCSQIFGGPSGPAEAVREFLAKPGWRRDLPQLLDGMTVYVDAARSPNWPEATSKMYVFDEEESLSRSGPFGQLSLVEILMPSLGRVFALHFRAVALRRMAAVALAIRLYEVDHGRRPETLEELVPNYLPTVPEDPFADDGRAMGYAPDAAPPVLYSVGSDGVDDGGEVHFYRDGAIDVERELPFFLNGDRDEVISRHMRATSQPDE